MPQVPVYGGQQLRDAPLEGGFARAPAGDNGAGAVARGLDQVDQFASKLADQENTDGALRTEAQIKTDFVKFEADLRTKAQGKDAVGYADAVKQWWDDAGKTYGGQLNGAQQRMIGRSLLVAKGQAFQGAVRYETQERDRSELEAFKGAQLAEIQRAGAAGTPEAAAAASELLRQRNAEWAAKKGLPPEQVQQLNMHDTTAVHVNMISRLQQSDPKAAQEYFNANKGEIDGTRHDEIMGALNKVSAAADGDAFAGDVWGRLGPKGYNQPIDLVAMEAEARKQFANDPARMQHALAAIKERAGSFNATEKEFNASNVNKVMERYAKESLTVAQVTHMPEFLALPGQEQAQIRDRIDNHINALVARGAAAEQRADAAESRAQRKLTRDGYSEFLKLSDPAVLSTMSEAQIQAKLPVLGNELTGHLLTQFRSTKNDPTKHEQWKMDTEDFNHVADQMGLKPFEKKTDEEKANLGELKYRVEQVIGVAEKAKGKALTREEKAELMTTEMARRVKTGGVFGFFASDKPVIGLSKDEIASVNVPPADRSQILEAMSKQYAKSGDKRFAPTEDNIRMIYLRGKSRSADFFPKPNE